MIEFGHDKQKGYWLRAEMFVDHPLETVFEFFADARQLERITPPMLNFKILTPLPVEMKAGLLLDYQISIHKIPIKWKTEIAVWDPPFRFVDRQLKGPTNCGTTNTLSKKLKGGPWSKMLCFTSRSEELWFTNFSFVVTWRKSSVIAKKRSQRFFEE